MKLSRRVTAILLIVLLALVGLELYLQSSNSAAPSPWVQTNPYPLRIDGAPGVAGQSCIVSNETVDCVGGQNDLGDPDDNVYYANLTSLGIGQWKNDSAYPQSVMFQSCVTSTGYIYCVGGVFDNTADDVPYSYYAPLTSTGVGAWKSTTSYPIAIDTESCVASTGYIYCVGGENQTLGTNATSHPSDSDWYAPLSSSGLGNWTQTTSYPSGLYYPVCTPVGGYVYCVGDEGGNVQAQRATYYAPLTSSGIGAWTSTTEYPINDAGQSCVASSIDLYCVAGWTGGTSHTTSVYYAQVTPSGIGSWQSASTYPIGVLTTCVSSSGYVYCMGGSEGSAGPVADSYYGVLAPQSSSTSAVSSSSS